MEVKSIVIVGGGSAGWMTAAAIAYKLPNIKLTLIESPTISNVGVGESTLGHINNYMDLLDLKDKEWMKECSATYKTSIQFTDFKEKGYTFQYPFGNYKAYKNGLVDFFDAQKQDPEISDLDFARSHSINALMAEHNKMWEDPIKDYGYDPKWDVAYHMDADAFGQYLKKRYCNKIKHVEDNVVRHQKDDNGNLEIISTESGLSFTADLFIDCTGFASLLIEKTMGVEFEKFKTLPNDSAVVARIPYKNELDKKQRMTCVTDCKALSAGWLWDIPLWSRLGTGYVYSSQFLSKAEAEKEFRKEINWDGDVRHLKFRHGKHKKAWEKNVVAVGLSYGFIEPLESTGLLTTHENIINLIHHLSMRNGYVNKFSVNAFNETANDSIQVLSNFVAIHYGMSTREDTPYWKYVTNEIDYDKTGDGDGITYIATGMGIKKQIFNKEKIPEVSIKAIKDHIKDLEYLVEQMPSHYEYLKSEIYK
tara:strand:+ start:7121 stop:8551 length:1431 start_codon:yes stop_codon:yes gene_type:complete